jgi:hypothetical protein
MEHKIAAFDRPGDRICIANIAFRHFHAIMP